MPYISTAELAERPGARELALAASSDTAPVVAYALMDATLRGADRSAWTPEQVVAADAALQRVQDAVAEAGAVIDGYLAQRGYALPLSLPPTSTGKSLLTAWARSIARYLLRGPGAAVGAAQCSVHERIGHHGRGVAAGGQGQLAGAGALGQFSGGDVRHGVREIKMPGLNQNPSRYPAPA